jgi:hypothetical protein
MAPLSLEQSLEISKLCEVIISLNPGIHVVSVVNKNGRILNTKLRNDSTTKNLTSQETEMLCMQRVLQMSMNKELDAKLGSLNYTISYRNFMLELIFPLLNGIIFVGADSEIYIQKLIKKISEAINNYKFDSQHKFIPVETIENQANSVLFPL